MFADGVWKINCIRVDCTTKCDLSFRKALRIYDEVLKTQVKKLNHHVMDSYIYYTVTGQLKPPDFSKLL